MLVRELIQLLQAAPQDHEVVISCSEYPFRPVEYLALEYEHQECLYNHQVIDVFNHETKQWGTVEGKPVIVL